MRSSAWITAICSLSALLCVEPLFAHGGGGGGHAGGGHAGGGHVSGGHHAGGPTHMNVEGGGHSGFGNSGNPFGNNPFGGMSPFGGGPQAPFGGGGANVHYSSPAAPPVSSGRHHTTGTVGQHGMEQGNFGQLQPAFEQNFSIGAGSGHHIRHELSGNQGHSQQNDGPNHFGLNAEGSVLRHAHSGTALYQEGQSNSVTHHHGHWNNHWGQENSTTGNGHSGASFRQVSTSNTSPPFFWGSSNAGSFTWGQGSLIYGSGYLGYMNPYYTSNDLSGFYNYTQPVLALPDIAQAMTTVMASRGQMILNAVVTAFLRTDYNSALEIVDGGIDEFPEQAVFHELRALILFAKGDYQQAASTIHAVLAVGPGWGWTTMISLYRDPNTYTNQLRGLEAKVKQDQNDGAVRLLLAYHYLTAGHGDAAARILKRVVTLVPNDRVAADLLKMVEAPTPEAPSTESPTAISVPVNAEALIGEWRAQRPDGSTFVLTLTNDNKFTWSFTHDRRPTQSFDGTYSLDGNTLTLVSDGKGSFVAAVNFTAENQFNFKIVGAPSDDPGLDFGQQNGR